MKNKKARRAGPKAKPPIRRFRKHVIRKAKHVEGMRSACDEWDACCDRAGFPVFAEKPNSPGGIVKAHHYSYEQYYDVKLEPRERLVRLCGNSLCVKPTHIKKASEVADKDLTKK